MLKKLIATLAVFGLFSVIAHGQPPKKDDKPPAKPGADKPPPSTRDDRLEVSRPSDPEFRAFNKLVLGNENPNTPEAKRLLDVMAKWMIYRLTWTEIQDGREPSMTILRDEIAKSFPLIPRERPDDAEGIERYNNRKAYVTAWRTALTGYMRDVLKTKHLIARVNVVQIMARFAELGQEEIADELLPILENHPEHDAVKHWVFLAYHDVFASMAKDSAAVAKDAKRQDRLTKGATAMAVWLDAKTRVPADSLRTMSPAEQDAIVYVRKAALRALATLKRPMVVETKNAQQGPIAATLLRIMVNEKGTVLPEPTWSERVEAAYALCNMQSKASATYQPDVAAYHIGRFAAALGAAASEDDTRAKDSDRARERWRFYASYLKAGADAMRTDTASSPAAAYVGAVLGKMEPLFNFLYDPARNPESVQELSDYLNGRPPKGTELFKAAAPAGAGGN